MATYEITQIEYCIEEENLELNENDYENYDDYEKACEDLIAEIESELPSRIVVDFDFDDDDDEEDIEYALCDYITDMTGWLVNNFCYEEVID
jgi:hypothetical protein